MRLIACLVWALVPIIDGCSSAGCSGTPEPCNYMTLADQCDNATGCQSSPAGGCATLGASMSDTCTTITLQSVCAIYSQCVWSTGTGSCLSMSGCGASSTRAMCEAASQCGWETRACTGTPNACSSHDEKTSCLNQVGCTWDS